MKPTDTFDVDRWMIVATADGARSNLAAATLLARLVALQPADRTWFYVADEVLSNDLHLSCRTVQRLRTTLIERGLVQCVRRRTRHGTKMHWQVAASNERRPLTRISLKRNEIATLVADEPMPPLGVWVVYRHYDADSGLLYVGRTKVFTRRQASHRSQAPWWPAVRRITVDTYPTFELCDAAELAAIRSERPTWNKSGRR